MFKSKKRRRIVLAGAVIASACVLGVPLAASASLFVAMPISATLPSGSSRTITAQWGYSGPYTGTYKVDFQCGVPGCANFVNNSTTTQSVTRTVIHYTCTGYRGNHNLDVTDVYGGNEEMSTYTRWLAGSFCR